MSGASQRRPFRLLVHHHTSSPNHPSAITIFLWPLLAELGKREHVEVCLFTNLNPDQIPDRIRSYGIQVIRERRPRNGLLAIGVNSIRLPALIRKTSASAVLFTSPYAALTGRQPRWVFVHDLYPLTNPELFTLRRRRMFKLITQLVFRRAERLLCISQRTESAVHSFHPSSCTKTEVVPLAPVLTQVLPPRDSSAVEGPYALMVCNATPNKDVKTALDALRILVEDGIEVPLIHVGGDPDGLLAKAANAHRLVTPLGFVSDTELRDLYSGATLFINSSVEEGYCLPVAEAQGFGVPVVCTDIPVLREVAGLGASYFPPGDVRAMAHHVRHLWTDQDARARLTTAGRQNASRYSWSNTVNGIIGSGED